MLPRIMSIPLFLLILLCSTLLLNYAPYSFLVPVTGQCARERAYIREVTSQPDCSVPGPMTTLPHPTRGNGTILLISCLATSGDVLTAVDVQSGTKIPLLSMDECGHGPSLRFTHDRGGSHLFVPCHDAGALYEIHANLTVTVFLRSSEQCPHPSSFLSDPTRPGRAFILCDDTIVERLEDGSMRATSITSASGMTLDMQRGILLVTRNDEITLLTAAVMPPSAADWSTAPILSTALCDLHHAAEVVNGQSQKPCDSGSDSGIDIGQINSKLNSSSTAPSTQWVVICTPQSTAPVPALLLTPNPLHPLEAPSIRILIEREQCLSPNRLAYPGGRFVVVACEDGGVLADFVTLQIQPLIDETACSMASGVAFTASSSDSHVSQLDRSIFIQCGLTSNAVIKSVSGLTRTRIVDSITCSNPESFLPDPQANPNQPVTDFIATCSASWNGEVIGLHGDGRHLEAIAGANQCYGAQSVVSVRNHSTGSVDMFVSCWSPPTYPSVVRIMPPPSMGHRRVVVPVLFPDCEGADTMLVDESTGIIVAHCSTGIMATRINRTEIIFEKDDPECKSAGRDFISSPQPGMIYVVCPSRSIWLVNLTSFGQGLPHLQRAVFLNATQCPGCQSMAIDPMTNATYVASRALGVMQLFPNGSTSLLFPPATCTPLHIQWDSFASVVAVKCDYPYDTIRALQLDPNARPVVASTIMTGKDCVIRSLVRDPYTGGWLVTCDSGLDVVSGEMRCTAGYAWSQGVCVACPLNTHKPAIAWNETKWSIGCLPCPRGTVQNKAGSARCDPCPPGTYESNYACIPCLPGYWQGRAGQTSCDMCEAGYEAPNQGSSICNKCTKGHYAEKNGTAQCLECSPGRHAKSEGATICEECQAGFVATKPAATECEPCMPGYYSDSPGSMSCSLCSPGSFQSEGNATSCDVCEPGRFSVATGSTNCSLCASGSYSDRNASSFCQPCALGSASNETGRASSCPLCDAGFYSGGIGLNVCLPCQPSSYSVVPGAAECAPCDQQVNANRTACTTNVCPANMEYSKLTGECVICPLGQYSSAGGSCTVCSVNSYTPQEGSGCISCLQTGMEGLICNGGLAAVKEGWWAYLGEPDPAAGMSLYRTEQCPQGYCPGSQLQALNSSHDHPTNATSPTLICLPPRVNSLDNIFCGRCEAGYIAWGEKCEKCDGVDGGLLFAGAILSFLLVLFLLRAGTNAAGPIAILLYFVQIAALEVGPVSQWLTWLQAVNFDSASTGKCMAPWTPPQQTLATLLMPVILMIELGIIAAIHYCMHRRYQARAGWQNEYDETLMDQALQGQHAPIQPTPSHSRTDTSRLHHLYSSFVRSFHRHRYLSGCISILLFCYTSIAVACVRYLYCVDVDGQRILFFAPSINCDRKEYQHYLIPVIIWMVVYVVAFPLIALIMLWRNRTRLYDTSGPIGSPNVDILHNTTPSASPSTPSSSSSSSPLRSHMKSISESMTAVASTAATPNPLYQSSAPLYAMYVPHAFMWQPFVLLRRFAFALVSVLLVRRVAIRFLSYLLLHFASLQLHAWVQPYGSRFLNLTDTASYSLLLILSAIMTGYQPPYTDVMQAIALLLIIPPAAALFLFILAKQIKHVKKQINKTRRQGVMNASNHRPHHHSPLDVSINSESLRV